MVEFCTKVKVYGAFHPVFEPKAPPSLLAFPFFFFIQSEFEELEAKTGEDCFSCRA